MVTKNDFEIPVTLGNTDVVVIVRMSDDVRKRRDDIFNQMLYTRGIGKPEMINMLDDDVRRILRAKGIDTNNLKGGRKEKNAISGTVRAVQGFHMENRQATFIQATMTAMLEDIFERIGDGKVRPKLRPDIAAIIPNDVIAEMNEKHFAETDLSDDELRYVPEPVIPDKHVPAEKLYVLAAALAKTYPEITDQLNEGRERMAQLDSKDGGVETDDLGFHASTLD